MCKVSIIVPIYNAEKFLQRCIDSILEQTYHDIEVILIDDGSTDRSGDICDTYAKKDKRVRVLHQANMGVGAARNVGIRYATGDYLQFVDSDDFIDDNMTATLVREIEKNSVSVVICGYRMIYSSPKAYSRDKSPTKVGIYSFDGLLDILDCLYIGRFINSPCNKIYRARIIRDNSILYSEDVELGEDLLFNLEVIKNSIDFQIVHECLYNYVKNSNNSALTGKYRRNIYEIQKMLFENLVSLYEDKKAYNRQLNNLEIAYSKMLISRVTLHIASCYSLKDFKSYLEAAKNIQSDAILNKTMHNLKPTDSQEKLLKFLLKRKMFLVIFIYAKIEQQLGRKTP